MTQMGIKSAFLAGAILMMSGCGWFSAAPEPGRALPLPPMSARYQGMTEAGYTTGVFDTAAVRNSIVHLHQDGVNWLAIQVAWYQQSNTSTTIAPNNKTPTDGSVGRLIALAHHEGMRVFLNPFVNSLQGSGWQAQFHPSSAKTWFASFDKYVAHYAQLGQRDHADLFAIGDEFDSLDNVPGYEPYWAQAISTARRWYHGPITYGADFPHYQSVTFWKLLDDVGIDAYFPLSSSSNPTVPQMESSWNSLVKQIQSWRQSAGLAHKGFLVTELGYPSEDGAAATPGTWFPNQPVNLAIQEKLYLATFQTLWQRPWVKGIMWFWWANPSNPDWEGGPKDNGYTLRGKPAQSVLKRYFVGTKAAVAKHNVTRSVSGG